MPRPKKHRKVCCLPAQQKFGPLGGGPFTEFVPLLVEEYETIRLIDLEGLEQEECANRMDVSRTTVQSIYADARKKIANALVNGKALLIEGGKYELCGGNGRRCGGDGCHKQRRNSPHGGTV